MTALAPRVVLLVEDSPPDAELVEHAFRGLQPACQIVPVRDGEEALRFLLAEPPYQTRVRPSLVLLDLNLPGTDGREVLRTLRRDPAFAALPVVVLTTSESPVDVEDLYALHANSYVTKPSDYEKFVAAMRCLHEYWFRVAKLPDPARRLPR